MAERILVTGGAGFIGSHTALCLLEAGYDVLIADNFCNSKPAAVRRLAALSEKPFDFVRCELTDAAAVEALFAAYDISAVIHFAGLKAVGESVAFPLRYYENNLNAAFCLLNAMKKHGVSRFVFSSSATVYGDTRAPLLTEDMPLSTTNPYGESKRMIERILTDAAKADPGLRVCLLRYFNPIGAHPSGRIGENPNGIPNNLAPYIMQVALGNQPFLRVFGNDYETRDGTGVRDYIHVLDLASGHVAALEYLKTHTGAEAFNLGTGKGTTVFELLHAFERAVGREIPYRICPRRPGDVTVCCADPSRAKKELGWEAVFSIDRMCEDTWRFQRMNPNGYDEEASL